ncbi:MULTISPECIES: Arc family DNA-binding protein [unclassified Pseudomonas]|uniref:Arc family DNA-binding protein n=1 Tax=unclassified Pseudomonas TaxID=196821 RepID=UPI00244AD19D|nr:MULTISPECIES: Arc family DNA-binding protein [unclassified Pseudomonas]MDG9927400.1 Arc family DNA-binding protein [Pseudomonas sp. GD04042]MDH0482469.1 Arc family DNA-binding protein [Pseudomonas sp. GD04015]MDH0602821.1 Arc family DNA-binding protein [Pseudomonas sp. GD03869]
MDNDDRYTRITLRIPKDLHSRLAQSAVDTSKSMNAEILSRLELTYAQDPALGFMSPKQRKAALSSPEFLESMQRNLADLVRQEIEKAIAPLLDGKEQQ